jgi:hypothetical protein
LISNEVKKSLGKPSETGIAVFKLIPEKVIYTYDFREAVVDLFMGNYNLLHISENDQKVYSAKIDGILSVLENDNIPADKVAKAFERHFKKCVYPTINLANIYNELKGDISMLYPEVHFKKMRVDDLDIYSKIESYWINYFENYNNPIELYKFIDGNDLSAYGYPKMWDGSRRKYVNKFPKPETDTRKSKVTEPFDIGENGREFLREYNLWKSQDTKTFNSIKHS